MLPGPGFSQSGVLGALGGSEEKTTEDADRTGFAETLQQAVDSGVSVVVVDSKGDLLAQSGQVEAAAPSDIAEDDSALLMKLQSEGDAFRAILMHKLETLPNAFREVASVLRSSSPDGRIMSFVEALFFSLALFALGLFGPGIATGLVTGAPQLGAGAAVGTVAAIGAAGAAGAAGAVGASKAAGKAAMGAAKAGASIGGGASMAFAMGKAASGAGGVKGAAAGLSAVAQAGAGTVANVAKGQASKAGGALKAASTKGARGAISGTGGSMGPAKGSAASAAADAASGGAEQAPDWAKKAKSSSNSHRAESAALHALRGGDSGGASSGPKLKDDD